MSIDWLAITQVINSQINEQLTLNNPQPLSGGCINQAWQLTDQHLRLWFIKTNQASLLPMFKAEALGLQAIRETRMIRAPEVLCAGVSDNLSFLAMEYIPLTGRIDGAQLGEQLAAMHAIKQDYFGWPTHNTIGTTPQNNTPEQNWVTFYQRHRLGYQLELALQNNLASSIYDKGQRLVEQLDVFFPHAVSPALVHGDLWGGNCAADANNQAIIFDPACYFGDRETDLAMTELFGGFDSQFKSAYQYHYPIDSGYANRKILYNLYHILNHYNLFGGGYAAQSSRMINQLTSQI